METLPKIYAPISDRNDRIISLLSSVLMRKMRQSNLSVTRNLFPSSLEIGSTTVAIVLVTTSETLQQLLDQITRNTCLHLFQIDPSDTKNTVKEQFQSLGKLIDPCIPIFLVTDGDFPWLHSDDNDPIPRIESKQHAWSSAVHFFPSKLPATTANSMDSRMVVLTDEQHMRSSSLFPDAIYVVVPPETTTDVWKCRLILKYIQAIASIQNWRQRSKL